MDRNKVLSLWTSGLGPVEIAKRLGIHASNVSRLLRTHVPPLNKKCEIFECNKTITTYDHRKVACCAYHNTLLQKRKDNKQQVTRKECMLPDCKKVIVTSHGKHFCSKACLSLDTRRWGDKKNGSSNFYRKLLGTFPHKCVVCGENRVLDMHHVVFHKNKSDKTSDTVWLCPNHHMMVHRGYAKIENGQYVSLEADILKGLNEKQSHRLQLEASIQRPSA